MPPLLAEMIAVWQLVGAIVLGAWIGGADAAGMMAVGLATAGMGSFVTMMRRAATGMRREMDGVEVDWEVELALVQWQAEEEAEEERQAMLRRIWDLEDAVVWLAEEEAARVRRSFERVAIGGG